MIKPIILDPMSAKIDEFHMLIERLDVKSYDQAEYMDAVNTIREALFFDNYTVNEIPECFPLNFVSDEQIDIINGYGW